MPLPAYAIILAGGYGTRFWPLSRRSRPKQFLPLGGKESLLQQTYRRVAPLFPRERIYVVGNAEHRALLRRQLPRVPAPNLLLEPVSRNTAAAIALAAAHISTRPRRTRDALLAVFPADHAVRKQARFRRLVRSALATAAAEDSMVVLGIPPTEPHTGYGYIERGRAVRRINGQSVYAVRRFTEKPDARTAARYLRPYGRPSGRTRRYLWNSGMFFWRLSTFSHLLRRHLPRTHVALAGLTPTIGRPLYAGRLRRIYPRLENISVDYALAEPAAARGRVRLIPAAVGWSDLGSWSALADWLGSKSGGAHFSLDANRNFIRTSNKFIAAIGIEDLIVVDTPDAVLVCRRSRAQDVGKVVHYLQKRKQRRLL